jgi:hypothetical protein
MKIKVTLDVSITDKVILAIVAALVGAEISAKEKINEWNARMPEKREHVFGIDVVAPQHIIDKGLDYLLAGTLTCPFKVKPAYQLKYGEVEEKYGLEQVLTDGIITRLALPTKRAYAQAAGILLGAEASSLVDLSKLVSPEKSKQMSRVLMCMPAGDLEKYMQAFQFFQQFREETGIETMLIDDFNFTYQSLLELVAESRLVVGPQSFCTYAAACLGVPCIEWCSSQQEISILSKWSSPKYGIILWKDFEHLTILRLQKVLARWEGLTDNAMTQHDMFLANLDGME